MGNFYMESTQINYRRDEKLKTVDQKLQELSETSAIDTDIAPVFKSTNTYQPGDMVYYRNKLYVFNVEHTGAWAAADVTATDVTTEISSLQSGLTDLTDCVGWGKRKNLMPLSTRSNIMLVNDNATWSGDTCIIGDATFTFTFNEHDVITSIKVEGNGTALSADVTLNVTPRVRRGLYVPNGDYILSGCPANGSASTYRMFLQKVSSGSYGTLANDMGSGASFTVDNAIDSIICRIALYKDYIIPSGGLMYYPMIRPASISDSTFEPAKPALGDFAWDANEKLPYVPNASGTYTLKATRSADGVVYSWVADTP